MKKIRLRKSSNSSKSKKPSVSSGSRSHYFHERASYQRKIILACLMAEASYIKQEKLQELAAVELKIKIEIEQAKARVKIIEGEE